MKPTAQQCHAMVTYYINKYEAVNGRKPAVNRNKGRYAFESILWDRSADETRTLVDFFITHYDKEFEWFTYNYEKVVEELEQHKATQERKETMSADTAAALERWNKRKEALGARRGRTDRSQGN